MKKLLITAMIITGFAAGAFAQGATATAAANATIVAPIAIAKTVDMNFGNVAVASTDGTVVLVPAGTTTPSGGVTLPSTPGTISAATFTVSGGTYTYAITLPEDDVIVLTGPESATMALNTFTSFPAATGTLAAGNEIITVGATLSVTAGQLVGAYTNAAAVAVMVVYN